MKVVMSNFTGTYKANEFNSPDPNTGIEELRSKLMLILTKEDGVVSTDIDEVIDLINQKVIEAQINDLKKYTIKGYISDNIASVTMAVLQAQLNHNKKGDSDDKS